jgi:hypothetical protein
LVDYTAHGFNILRIEFSHDVPSLRISILYTLLLAKGVGRRGNSFGALLTHDEEEVNFQCPRDILGTDDSHGLADKSLPAETSVIAE